MIHTINCMYSKIPSWRWIACLFETYRRCYQNKIQECASRFIIQFITMRGQHNIKCNFHVPCFSVTRSMRGKENVKIIPCMYRTHSISGCCLRGEVNKSHHPIPVVHVVVTFTLCSYSLTLQSYYYVLY